MKEETVFWGRKLLSDATCRGRVRSCASKISEPSALRCFIPELQFDLFWQISMQGWYMQNDGTCHAPTAAPFQYTGLDSFRQLIKVY